jgi:hypothetical protein
MVYFNIVNYGLSTHLGHVLIATAVNFVRIGEWLAGTPRAKTRHPSFADVLAPAA